MSGLNPEQQAVIKQRQGARCVISGPGSGKTATMVKFFEELRNSGIPAANIRCVTFSKEAAETIERRAGIKGVFSTFHSLGYQICTDLAGFKPVEPELRYRLMSKLVRKWGLDYKDFDSFISKMRRENLSPKDAAEAGEYEYGACSAYAEYERVRAAEGWMDFDSMLCDAVNLLENPEYRSRYQYEYLIVDEAQDTDNCHPPGTLVWKLNAKRGYRGHRASWIETPVEDLQNGDFVVSWNRRHAQLTYIPQPISIGKRYFSGDLIQVRCRNKMVEVTPDHQFYVTLNGQEHTTYVVYLMYRSDLGFRVGQCAMRYERNTPKKRKSIPGLGTRFAEERAERGWILRVCTSREESMIWEQIYSCNFSIPYATYGDKTYSSPFRKRNAQNSRIIFQNVESRGQRCLQSEGLDFERPLYTRNVSDRGERKSPSSRYFITSACNLRPDIMSIPSIQAFEQTPITSITRRPYSGLVYSLNVPKFHTYVANGLVVKNCQWRMMQLLSEKHGNITVVGDPNQCIYKWRGAHPENLTNFEKWFPKGTYYYLGRNYRGTQSIVNFVRRHAPKGCPKPLLDLMLPVRSEVGVPIGLKMYWRDEDEAEAAVKLSQSDPLNTIIIARTNRVLGAVERVCNKHSIRYHLLGKSGFWKQAEVRKAIEEIKNFEKLPLANAVSLALPKLEAKYAVDDRTERDNDALDNLKTLRTIAAQGTSVREFTDTKDFLTYCNKMVHRRNDAKGVVLATVHAAKGSEYKNVFVIGAKNGMMPHKKGDPEEEARIWFVAISRAIDRLRISWAGTPTPFLDCDLTEEIKDKLMEKASEVERIEGQSKLF